MAGFAVTLWKSCLSMSPGLAAANVIAIVIQAVVGVIRGKKGNIVVHTSIWSGSEEEDAAAAAAISRR